jgi:hypothetical protein
VNETNCASRTGRGGSPISAHRIRAEVPALSRRAFVAKSFREGLRPFGMRSAVLKGMTNPKNGDRLAWVSEAWRFKTFPADASRSFTEHRIALNAAAVHQWRPVARRMAGRTPGGPSPPNIRSLKERVGALRNLWPFVAIVWRTSPQLTAASLLLRLLRALLPVVACKVTSSSGGALSSNFQL